MILIHVGFFWCFWKSTKLLMGVFLLLIVLLSAKPIPAICLQYV